MDQNRIVAALVKRHGILVHPDDPVMLVSAMLELHEADLAEAVAEMRRIVAEGQARADATMAEAKQLTAAAEKAATRPLLTPHQLQHNVMPKLVASLHANLLFKMLAALTATAVVCAGLGVAGMWWFAPRQEPLTCGATLMTQTGLRNVCFRDDGPAPTPSVVPEPKPPEATPTTKLPTQKKGT